MKNPISKSIAVIGEGPTEYHYIDNLRTTERLKSFKIAPSVAKHTDIDNMVAMAVSKMKEGFDYVVCLIDMDIILKDNSKKIKYDKYKSKYPKIIFIESNPCIEYWFWLHFTKNVSSREFDNYEAIEKELKKYIPDYEKTTNFLVKKKIYKYLKENGDLSNAIKLSNQLNSLHRSNPDIYKSYSQMYKLFELL